MTQTTRPTATGAAPLIERIAQLEPGLRRSERKVAAVVLADPTAAVGSTMAGLAEAADVSVPTVMRFCAAVGCESYQSFKLELAQSVALGMPPTHSAISVSDDLGAVAGKVVDQTISTLDLVRRNLDLDALQRAVDALLGAQDILFVGLGASGIIAQDAQQKFPLFGVPCQAPADVHQQFMAASMSGPQSVVFAISNTGHTPEVLRVARESRRAGATVIGMSGQDGPLIDASDIGLVVRTYEDTDYFTPTISRLAGLVVIDVLATAVAVRRPSEHLDRVQTMKQRLAEMRQDQPGG